MLPLIFRVAVIFCYAALRQPAQAHPHIWVTVVTEVLFAPDGSTGIHHSWTFDRMCSAYAVQGLAGGKDGFSRDDLAPLAMENIGLIPKVHYFTFATAKSSTHDIYEPDDFIEFSLAEKNPAALVDAHSKACRLSVARPDDTTMADQQLPEIL